MGFSNSDNLGPQCVCVCVVQHWAGLASFRRRSLWVNRLGLSVYTQEEEAIVTSLCTH